MTKLTSWERACNAAANRGRQDGHNAACWMLQDLPGGGRCSRNSDGADNARAVLAMLDECDFDLPAPDFSGQWADGADWDELAREILDGAGFDYHAAADGNDCPAEGPEDAECECWQSDDGNIDLLGEYEAGFSQGAEMTIRRAMMRAAA
jgi:hypothetical protein